MDNKGFLTRRLAKIEERGRSFLKLQKDVIVWKMLILVFLLLCRIAVVTSDGIALSSVCPPPVIDPPSIIRNGDDFEAVPISESQSILLLFALIYVALLLLIV